MRRAEREVTDRGQLLEIISRCTCCRVAFSDPEGAYIVPLSFAFVPGQPDRFYFHGAKEGRKASLIAQKPKVGFELDCAYELVAGQSSARPSLPKGEARADAPLGSPSGRAAAAGD